MKKNIKIMVVTHREVPMPTHEYFFPIQAGTEVAPKPLPYTHDNTGDNISYKNKSYCELTAHYWVWKNLKNVDIVGLNHYRRFFDFYRPFKAFSPDRSFTDCNKFLEKDYVFPDLEKMLSEYDIVLSKTRNQPYNLTTQYSVFHIVNDWNILREVINDLSPEYNSAFIKTMDGSNSMSYYNMFITHWKHFDGYSEWLFRILEEVEKRVKLSAYPDQGRLFGYLSERLINVYCEHHQLKIKHYPVIMLLEDFRKDYNPSNFRYTWRRVKNNLSYFFNKTM